MDDFARMNAALEAGDFLALYALADFLEEQGVNDAAAAYRWLADNKKVPMALGQPWPVSSVSFEMWSWEFRRDPKASHELEQAENIFGWKAFEALGDAYAFAASTRLVTSLWHPPDRAQRQVPTPEPTPGQAAKRVPASDPRPSQRPEAE